MSIMRQKLSISDEDHLDVRSLSVDYAPNASTGLHRHDWAQLVYVEDGLLRTAADAAFWLVSSGRGLWLPAGVEHDQFALGRARLRTLYFRPGSDMTHASPRVLRVSPLLHQLILRVCQLQWLDRRESLHRHLAALLRHETAALDAAPVRLDRPSDVRAARLAAMFIDAANDEVPLTALLTRAGLSRRTAERLFAAESGMTPAAWWRTARLYRAYAWLAAGESVDSVATRCGYRSRSAFSDAFTRLVGQSPATVRSASKRQK